MKPSVFIDSVSSLSLQGHFHKTHKRMGPCLFYLRQCFLRLTLSSMEVSFWQGQGCSQVLYNRMVARWTNHCGGECKFMNVSHTTHWVGCLAAFESAPKLISVSTFEKLNKRGLKQTKYCMFRPLVKAFKHRQVGVSWGMPYLALRDPPGSSTRVKFRSLCTLLAPPHK